MLTPQSLDWQDKVLGRYHLLRLLGRGGMGEVWLAEDIQLRRQVAVKLLPAVYAQDQNYRQAFAHEARATAALEHPNILPVHDFGEQPISQEEIVTYLVMPYITGGTLRDRLRNTMKPLMLEESLRYLRHSAQAIDYAHSRQVLHRDIKPANMLLQQEWLFLTDFGIAKVLSTTRYTKTHAGAGTPQYMAPEQAQGKAEAASDRYSLAIVAYLLFTGQLPFTGETPYNVLMKQIVQMPPPPHQFNPTIPEAVEAVLLGGLAKSPAERPPSCVAFVDELERTWKDGEGHNFDPEATILAPWSKRRREITSRMPVSSPSLLPTPQFPPTLLQPQDMSTPQQTPAYYQSYPLPTPNQDTGQLAQSWPGYNASPQRQSPDLVPAAQPTKGGHKTGRRAFLIGVAATAGVAAVGGTAAFALLSSQHAGDKHPKATPVPGPQKLIAGVPVLSLTGHNKTVNIVSWDPSGRYLVSGGEDNKVLLWEVGSHLQNSKNTYQAVSQPLRTWHLASFLFDNTLSWSPDGRSIAVVLGAADSAPEVHVLDPSSQQELQPFTLPQGGTSFSNGFLHVAWSPRGDMLAASTEFTPDATIWRANRRSGPTRTFHYASKISSLEGIKELAWSRDGKFLAGITNASNAVIWDAGTGLVKQVIITPDRTKQSGVEIYRSAIQWSPKDPNLLVCSDTDIAVVWDTLSGQSRFQFGTDDKGAYTPPPSSQQQYFTWVPNMIGLAWSPNGRYLVGSYGRTAKLFIWDIQNPGPQISLEHPDTKMIKGTAHKQNLTFGENNGHQNPVTDIAWSPDGRYLATSSFDTTVIIWKLDAA